MSTNKVVQIGTDFANWSDNDLKEYMQNKIDSQKKYDATGKWDMDLYARNTEIRNRYGVKEDKYHYTEIQSYASDRLGNYLKKNVSNSEWENINDTDYGSLKPSNSSGGGYASSGGGSSAGGGSSGGGFGIGGEQFQMILGIGVLYMFLSLFKR